MKATVSIPEVLKVQAGEFWMGENPEDKFANDTERPRHKVGIEKDFALGIKAVTVDEFQPFHGGNSSCEAGDLPVVGVSWIEAASFCEWLSAETGGRWRLPSEAEWEYAARAGSPAAHPWEGGISLEVANFLYSEQGLRVGLGRRLASGSRPPNAWGFFDMLGNVNEWVEDTWHESYAGAPSGGRAWVADGRLGWRTLRGGAWDYLPRLLRTSWRDGLPAEARCDNLGFRVVKEL